MAVPEITVQAAFGYAPSAAPMWTTIHTGAAPDTGYVRALNYQRGRQNELNRMAAGTGSLLLRDKTSDFDSRNAAGRFYPNVKPMTPVRATALIGGVTYNLMYHFFDRMPRTMRVTSAYTERSLTTVDGFELLANAGLAGKSYASVQSDVRVTNVLDDISWSATLRSIGAGNSPLDAITFAATDGTKALEHLLSVMESENGLLFMDGQGRVAFIGRRALVTSPYTVSQATFCDDQSGGGYPYVDSIPVYDKDLVVNDWRGTRAGGVTQIASDVPSQLSNGPRSQQFSSLVTTDAEVSSQMQWKLSQFKDPLNRLASITVMPATNTTFWQAVLALDVGSRITVRELPPGFSVVQSSDYIVQNLSVAIPAGPVQQARFTFGLWPANMTAYWVLGDANNSQLGVTTRLAY